MKLHLEIVQYIIGMLVEDVNMYLQGVVYFPLTSNTCTVLKLVFLLHMCAGQLDITISLYVSLQLFSNPSAKVPALPPRPPLPEENKDVGDDDG